MDDTFPLPRPGPSHRDEMLRAIDQWTASQAMRSLVALFGGELESDWSLAQRLDFLVSFSERWDFRRGAERLEAVSSELSKSGESTVRQAVAALGMTARSEPSKRSYDGILVLGGIATSCKLRTEHAAELVRDVGVRSRVVALLGSARPIPESERALADEFAPAAKTEFDLLNAAAEAAFSVSGYTEVVSERGHANLKGVVRRYEHAEPPLVSLSSPSSDPTRRANTDDTFVFFAETFGTAAGESFLLCTSQVYVPFHLFGALRSLALPYGVFVETVGFPIERATGAGALRGVNNLLQEVRSGIQAASRLHQALTAVV